jgi:heme/copper-type cytochrome/quinol oxidase subunit 4
MEENNSSMENNKAQYKEEKSIGVAIFILLVALTIGEFFIGMIAVDWNWPLWSIAILKAAVIIYYFMHVTKVFGLSKEEIDDDAS